MIVAIADGGRKALPHRVTGFVEAGNRLVTADVFGTGESETPPRLQMVLASAGERPLGILVGQILALARWAGKRKGIRLQAIGPITSFAALCAAALEPERFTALHLDGLHDSLKRLIDMPVAYDSAVPLFCFGLLEVVDVPELFAMTAGLSIDIRGRGPIQPIV